MPFGLLLNTSEQCECRQRDSQKKTQIVHQINLLSVHTGSELHYWDLKHKNMENTKMNNLLPRGQEVQEGREVQEVQAGHQDHLYQGDQGVPEDREGRGGVSCIRAVLLRCPCPKTTNHNVSLLCVGISASAFFFSPFSQTQR